MSGSMAISAFIDILRFWSYMTSERGGGGRRREGYGCDKAVSYNFGQNEWKTYPPPLPPQSKMGKWRVFALRAASSLIWGRGGGRWGLLFNFILSKIVSNLNVFEPLLTPKICYPKTDS